MNYAENYAVGDILIDNYIGSKWVVESVASDHMNLRNNRPGDVTLHVSDDTCRMKFVKVAQ